MGISTNGGMIVGCKYSDVDDGFEVPEEYDGCIYEYMEDRGGECYSPWYDCDVGDMIIGFEIDDVPVDRIDSEWVLMLKDKAMKFETIFGVPAILIGMQDVN